MNSLSLKRDQDKISPFGNEMVNDFSFFTVTVTSEFVFGECIDYGGQLFKWVSERFDKLGQLSSSRESCDYKRKSFVCFSRKFLNCLLISSVLQQPPRKSGWIDIELLPCALLDVLKISQVAERTVFSISLCQLFAHSRVYSSIVTIYG